MRSKEIAAGFDEDARKLLNDFLEVNSMEFSSFASVWRKYKFSLIFMGRPDDTELTEFTNELFKKSSQFLLSLSLPYQVGAMFLLYALYRNQISVPPLKIRIEMDHWKVICIIRQEAIVKKYRSLHYVIDYLISNAFIFVAHQTLRGPVIASVQKLSKSSEIVANMKANYKDDLLEYGCSSSLLALHDLNKEYLEVKKNCDGVQLGKSVKTEMYKDILGHMESVLSSTPRGRGKGGRNYTNIGTRRSEIKAAAFSKKSKDFWGRNAESAGTSDSDDDSDDKQVPLVKPVSNQRRRAKRVPRHERRVGRPRIKPLKKTEQQEEEEEEDIDISHLLKQQEEFYLPPEMPERGNIRTVRFPYYKSSPKHDGDD